MTTLPTRAAIDAAEPLDFDKTRSEKPVSITIEAGPSGIVVRVDYQGTLGSIPAAIERLKAAGVLELVSGAARTPSQAPNGKPKADLVQPEYKPDGTPCCPVHKGALAESKYDGWYCRAKANQGDVQNAKGYCALRFSE